MRRATAFAVSALMITSAQAADYLRGPLPEPAMRSAPTTSYDWSGTYFGGHYAFSHMSFNNYDLGTPAITRSVANSELATGLSTAIGNSLFGKGNSNKSGFGGYIGYNTMWDDVVVGVEAEYTRVNAAVSTSGQQLNGTLGSTATPTSAYDYALRFGAKTSINDYYAFKGRAGMAIDRALLYASLGVAMANVTRETTGAGTWEQYVISPRATQTGVVNVASAGKQSLTRWGFAAGLGAEYAMTDNIVLRGEWQYLGFGSLTNLTSTSKNGYYTLNTLRAGLATKF